MDGHSPRISVLNVVSLNLKEDENVCGITSVCKFARD